MRGLPTVCRQISNAADMGECPLCHAADAGAAPAAGAAVANIVARDFGPFVNVCSFAESTKMGPTFESTHL